MSKLARAQKIGRRATLAMSGLVASARSRPLLDCAHTTESTDQSRRHPPDLKREADHEKLVRVFPVVGETIEPKKTYAGAKSRRRFRISNHCCPVKPGSPARNGMILNRVLSI